MDMIFFDVLLSMKLLRVQGSLLFINLLSYRMSCKFCIACRVSVTSFQINRVKSRCQRREGEEYSYIWWTPDQYFCPFGILMRGANRRDWYELVQVSMFSISASISLVYSLTFGLKLYPWLDFIFIHKRWVLVARTPLSSIAHHLWYTQYNNERMFRRWIVLSKGSYSFYCYY